MQRLEGKPFALIGVNSDADRDELKRVMKKEGITWRSFWDGGSPSGPIAKEWNVSGWPTVYVLDAQGTIRFKNVFGEDLDRAIESLLEELGSNGSAPASEKK